MTYCLVTRSHEPRHPYKNLIHHHKLIVANLDQKIENYA